MRLGQSTRAVDGFGLTGRSALGRFLRGRLDLNTADYPAFLDAFLGLRVGQGFLVR